MADGYLRQSPLAHLGLEGRARAERGAAGVALSERRFPGIVNLRGEAEAIGAAFEQAFGFALPVEANRADGKDGFAALWLGPDEWWVLAPDGAELAVKLAAAMEGQPAAVTQVSESRTCIRVAGPHARDTIMKGCPLDLHPRVFQPGDCAQTCLSKADIALHQVDDEPTFDLYVLRSFAEYAWLWLEDAALEYGVTVVSE